MQKPHELDILIVVNPDLNCPDIDTEEGWKHKDFFQVRWSGAPHRIIPGQTRRMMRFLAEHFAKHLANHILIKKEEGTGKKGLMQSPVERPKVLKSILIGIDSYFLMADEKGEGERVTQMVDQLNPTERPLNLGVIPDPTMGVLKSEPPSLDQVMKKAGLEEKEVELPKGDGQPPTVKIEEKTSIWDPKKPKPTKVELIKDAVRLGLDIKGTETVDQLIGMIKKF